MKFIDIIKKLKSRYKTSWNIFYHDKFGKAGLFIMMFFVIVAIISPILTFHDPMVYTVPAEDAFVANQIYSTHSTLFNSSYYPIASASLAEGSFLALYVNGSGKVVGIGLGDTPKTPLGKIFQLGNISTDGSTLYQPTAITMENYIDELSGSIFYRTFIVYATTGGTIGILKIGWSGFAAGAGTPEITASSHFTLNGSIVEPLAVGAPTVDSELPTFTPAYGVDSYTPGVGGSSGYIYAVSHTSNGYYLNAFFACPLSLSWSVKLPLNSLPSQPLAYGYMHSTPVEDSVIIGQNNTLVSYNTKNGTLLWSDRLPGQIDRNVGMLIPEAYQESSNSYNRVFVALSDPSSVDGITLSNGSITPIMNFSQDIIGMSSTIGNSGFPSELLVQTTSNAYFIDGPKSISTGGNITLPVGFGSYNTKPVFLSTKSEFLVTTSLGYAISYISSLGTDPAQWHTLQINPSVKQVSNVTVFMDSNVSNQVFTYTTSNNYLVIYSSSPIDDNPLPPTYHSLSGTPLLFGTNSFGNDVWSQFFASFPFSWILGISIGVTVIVLATIMAMLVGFLGGAASYALESFSLALFLIPGLPLLIGLVSVLKLGMTGVVIVIALLGWPFTAFTLIGVVKSIKTRTYIMSARVSGVSTLGILKRHMLPNMTPLLLYFMAGAIAGGVGAVSTLQFIGVAPLTIATWGAMLEPALSNFYLAAHAYWWIIPPTAALTMFVVGFIFISRGMDEVVNPRLRRR